MIVSLQTVVVRAGSKVAALPRLARYLTFLTLAVKPVSSLFMVLSNAERQSRYKQRLRQAAYENEVLKKQIAALEIALNEVRHKVGLPEIQLPKSAYAPHR